MVAVVTIIFILGAITLGAIVVARHMMRQRVAEQFVKSVSIAVEAYNQVWKDYPASSDINSLIVALTVPVNGKGPFLNVPAGSDAASMFIDPWDRSYVYIYWKDYGTDVNGDGTNDGFVRSGSQYYHPRSFQFYSLGKDGRMSPGNPNDPVNEDNLMNF